MEKFKQFAWKITMSDITGTLQNVTQRDTVTSDTISNKNTDNVIII